MVTEKKTESQLIKGGILTLASNLIGLTRDWYTEQWRETRDLPKVGSWAWRANRMPDLLVFYGYDTTLDDGKILSLTVDGEGPQLTFCRWVIGDSESELSECDSEYVIDLGLREINDLGARVANDPRLVPFEVSELSLVEVWVVLDNLARVVSRG